MDMLLAATVMWCLASADDHPASDCGLTEAEVACLAPCDDEPVQCVEVCISTERIRELRILPLYHED